MSSSSSSATTRARQVIGPLTTTFVPPPSCSSSAWLAGALDEVTESRTATLEEYFQTLGIFGVGNVCGTAVQASCLPGVTSVATADGAFYSPGLACPTGFSIAASAASPTPGLNGYVETEVNGIALDTMMAGETAVVCCPSPGFTFVTTSLEPTETFGRCRKVVTGAAFSALSTLTYESCAATSSSVVHSQIGASVAATYTSQNSVFVTTVALAGVTVWAPAIQLNYRSEDIGGGGHGGLSKGATAGITLGVIAVLIIIGVLGFYAWRRRRQKPIPRPRRHRTGHMSLNQAQSWPMNYDPDLEIDSAYVTKYDTPESQAQMAAYYASIWPKQLTPQPYEKSAHVTTPEPTKQELSHEPHHHTETPPLLTNTHTTPEINAHATPAGYRAVHNNSPPIEADPEDFDPYQEHVNTPALLLNSDPFQDPVQPSPAREIRIELRNRSSSVNLNKPVPPTPDMIAQAPAQVYMVSPPQVQVRGHHAELSADAAVGFLHARVLNDGNPFELDGSPLPSELSSGTPTSALLESRQRGAFFGWLPSEPSSGSAAGRAASESQFAMSPQTPYNQAVGLGVMARESPSPLKSPSLLKSPELVRARFRDTAEIRMQMQMQPLGIYEPEEWDDASPTLGRVGEE